jgi:tetratricopeptide (TPR) repeat protein
MYNIIPLALSLISLSVILYIVTKKFSALATLDVDSIQSEKEAKIKERIIGKKLKRNIFRYGSNFFRILEPIYKHISNFFKWIFGKLLLLKENYSKDLSVQNTGQENISIKDKLLNDAENYLNNGQYDEAEKNLIEAIGMDSKDISLFVKLGHLYYERSSNQEALQTLEHALKLCEVQGREGSDLGNIYFDLAEVYEKMDNLSNSLIYSNKAVKVEPNNPRYLDMKLRISIMLKDKVSALESFEKLLEVNPENQKLIDFKKQIDEI